MPPEEGGFVDENGMPVELPYGGSENRPPEEGNEPQVEPPVMDQRWLDEQTGGGNGAQPKAPQPAPKAPPANKALPPAVKSSTVRVQSGSGQSN